MTPLRPSGAVDVQLTLLSPRAGVVVLLIIIIPYTTVAYAQYPFQALASGTANIGVFNLGASVSDGCVPPYWFGAYDLGGGTDCNPNLLGLPEGTWTQRVQFPVYLVAIMSILGWCLMSVFAAVGSLALPIDWLLDFADRPKKVITKSEYINKARQIARCAPALCVCRGHPCGPAGPRPAARPVRHRLRSMSAGARRSCGTSPRR